MVVVQICVIVDNLFCVSLDICTIKWLISDFFVSLIQAAEVIVPEFLVEIINSGMCPQDHIIMKTFNPILCKLIGIGNSFRLQILSNFFKAYWKTTDTNYELIS